jgi:D-glycero-alpha-D-manno-heptose 1-phosphate guanylyltransferase
MIKEVIILAGGLGTRLRPVIADLPKPLAPVLGKPFLHYIFASLKKQGIEKAILSVGYMAEKIQQEFGNEHLGIKVDYVLEEEPLGTGGGIRLGMQKCTGAHVLVMNGDTLFDIPLVEFTEAHLSGSSDATLALRKVDDASRYGTIELEGKRVIAFIEKSPEITGSALINGGIYAIRRKNYLGLTPTETKFSIEQDYFAKYADKLWLQGIPYDSYFIDIGVPEDYARAEREFVSQ